MSLVCSCGERVGTPLLEAPISCSCGLVYSVTVDPRQLYSALFETRRELARARDDLARHERAISSLAFSSNGGLVA